MQTKKLKRKTNRVKAVGSGAVLGVTGNKNKNAAHPACHQREQSHRDTTIPSTCAHALEHGLIPVLSLLGMMQCPEVGIDETLRGKEPRVRQAILALRDLWQSLGHPRDELWLRLHLYNRGNDLCSYKKDDAMTHNESKLSHAASDSQQSGA